MITQFTTTSHSVAAFGIFAGRHALTTTDTAVGKTEIFRVAEKSARPESTVSAYRPTRPFRFVADVFTCPVAAPEMTAPVANLWKQLIGGNGPPAPELLPLT